MRVECEDCVERMESFEALGTTGGAGVGGLLLVRDMLPSRRRGTRVCSFCSRFRTRARISDTICTPLLLEVAATIVAVLVAR